MYPTQLPRSYAAQQTHPHFQTRVPRPCAPVTSQPSPPISPRPQDPRPSSQQPQPPRSHPKRTGACCPTCGESYPSGHQRRHSLAPGEAANVGICARCKKDSLSTGGDGGIRGRRLTGDSHSVKVRTKGDQIQIRIFSDPERKSRNPEDTVFLQHPKSVKRAESVPARPSDVEQLIPTKGFPLSANHTSRCRSRSRRGSPGRPASLLAGERHDPYAGETDFPLSGANSNHLTHRLPKAQLRDRDRFRNQDPTPPVDHTGNPYPHHKTHEEYRDAFTGSPAYEVGPSHLSNLREDTQRFGRKRSDSCGSTDAVVGSPHVRFGSDVYRHRTNISDVSGLPQRRRTRVTDEINRVLGPDSDSEDKGEDTGHLPWGDESAVTPSYLSTDSKDSRGSQSYRSPYVQNESDDDITPMSNLESVELTGEYVLGEARPRANYG
ncbi:hypothetical protein FGG08_000813 [Glutinoglossum americanum]|uniref:Uncharacterized protein n=1 Tax=Glutinoglossum americanum TaxID=1670608 RepID=A0A9P8I9F1_9PEZI|nr:hypothetical protein FGG08_000813 [Glutinoglossum americanum]